MDNPGSGKRKRRNIGPVKSGKGKEVPRWMGGGLRTHDREERVGSPEKVTPGMCY